MAGRKSAAALAVVTQLPGQRPEPPADLTSEQAEEWRAVVGSEPADWFPRATHGMLADYCRSVVLARHVAAQINAFDMALIETEEGLKRFDKLSAILERHTRASASLATRMRLTQQSRYNALSANTAHKPVGGTQKPWEYGT